MDIFIARFYSQMTSFSSSEGYGSCRSCIYFMRLISGYDIDKCVRYHYIHSYFIKFPCTCVLS